jgi:hypothetical protein
MKTSSRPYVICHMGPSIDGRIVTKGWKVSGSLGAEYERCTDPCAPTHG